MNPTAGTTSRPSRHSTASRSHTTWAPESLGREEPGKGRVRSKGSAPHSRKPLSGPGERYPRIDPRQPLLNCRWQTAERAASLSADMDPRHLAGPAHRHAQVSGCKAPQPHSPPPTPTDSGQGPNGAPPSDNPIHGNSAQARVIQS